MLEKLYELKKRTMYSLKNFKCDPISNLGFLIVVTIVLTASIGGVVAYVIFVVNGGYTNQIMLLKNQGIDGIMSGFTSGTVELITSGVVAKIIAFLVCSEFVVMLINYFKHSGKAKKTIMIIDLVLCTFVVILSIVLVGIIFGKLMVSEEKAYMFLGAFEGVTINLKAIFISYLVVAVVAFVTLVVLIMITAECRWMVGYTVLVLIFSNAVMPLFLLLLENIIPLVIGVVLLIVIGVILTIIFKMMLNGSDSEGGISSSGTTSAYDAGDGYFDKTVEKKSNQIEKKYELNSAFWRDKGGYGFMVPTVDCIYVKNAWGDKTYVCTVSDFETGNVAIINKGVRVMNIAGCKAPEK